MRKLRDPRKVGFLSLVPLAAIVAAACSPGSTGSGGTSASGGAGGQQTTSAGGKGGAASTTSSSTSGSTSSTSSSSGSGPCTGDADCAGSPKGAFCDTNSGNCVACLPAGDACGAGSYCDPTTFRCVTGCNGDADCAGDPNGAVHCDPAQHVCVNCLTENDCPAGQVCVLPAGLCIPGCSPTHDCPSGFTCCGTACYDLANDAHHCGDCSKGCTAPINGTAQCQGGLCGLKACLPAFADCNGNLSDGCEWNILQDGPCTCTPGATQACYQGAPGTQNVGPCKAGTQTCDASGTSWGPCIGQVLPVSEICANGIDEDCDGTVDNASDLDGDGWTICNGDCDDSNKLINPGAFEVAGDGIDNDCDGVKDNPVTTACSSAMKIASVTGTNVANAMDICQTTVANATGPNKKWGLITADLRLADGTLPTGTALSDLQNKQTAITTQFGNTVKPKKNLTMAIISSGMARDANDTGWVLPVSGTALTTSITFPGGGPLATYVNAHGGNLLPGKCGSTTCPVGTGANDSVNVRMQIRTPTNAQGFSYDFRFYSGEYQSFQCTIFNDYYLASLTTGAPGIPADHNISFDSLKNAVSVNNGFFQDCGGNGKGCGTCPFGTTSLAGTGFEQVNGGSTEWLTTDSPIVPGETITLELVIFDVGDHIYDTLVLLDNFRWSLTPVTLGTHL